MLSRLTATPAVRNLTVLLVIVLLAPTPALPQGQGTTAFKAEELEQIAAPIALYPDPLVAQIFMASTYPLELVEAARFAKANASLKGDQLDAALKQQTWDDSVKALVSFPQVLTMMSDKLDWTQKLGDAFLGQQKELMGAVQRLRSKAQAQGTLKDSQEQKVVVEPAPPPAAGQPAPQTTIIKIEPANPQVVYVPTYNPTVVYGAWPYPAYPPYYYYPPGYAAATAATAVFSFAAGVAVGSALWGGCNWGRGDVDVNINQYNNFTKNVNTTNVASKRSEFQKNRVAGSGGAWQHDPEHRKGVQYRDTATQQRFNKTGAPNPQAREQFRGRAQEGRQELAQGNFQGRGGGAGPQVGQRGGASRGQERAGGQVGSSLGQQGGQALGQGRGGGAGLGQHGASGASFGQSRGGGAFHGVGQGSSVRDASNRGAASRQSFQAAGGGHGGFSGSGGAARGGGARGRR